MRAFFCHLAPVGVLVLGLGVPLGHAASSPIDPDPRAPSLGELLAREEAARSRIERVVEPVLAPTPVALSAPTPVAQGVVRGGVRQVHPAFAQPAVTVLVPGGKLAR